MNTTLSTAPGRHDHPPQPTQQPAAQRPVNRVNPLDRVALHVGVALIKWGRRPRSVATFERRATRVERRLARIERDYQRQQLERADQRALAYARARDHASAQRPLRPML